MRPSQISPAKLACLPRACHPVTFVALAVAIILSSAPGAQAQLQLPGGLPPAGAATPKAAVKSPGGKKSESPGKLSGASIKAPTEDAVIGRDLALNGSHGRIEFARSADGLSITRLTLDGDQISRPDDNCRVDVVSGSPIATKPLGRPMGMLRFQVPLEACPFSFDVLDGAILANPLPQACLLKAADCKVDPSGLWGPHAASLGPERIKEIERGRPRAETTMRDSFRALLARTKGRVAVKAAASEQAGFSSVRATICRDYAKEDVHGFCALRMTEARSLALSVAVGQASDDLAIQKAEKRKRKK